MGKKLLLFHNSFNYEVFYPVEKISPFSISTITIQLKVVLCVLQFGMLIEFLFQKFPNWEEITEAAVGDLQVSEDIKIVWIVVGSCLITFFSIWLYASS